MNSEKWRGNRYKPVGFVVGPSGNESLSAIGLYLAVKLFYILPLLPTLVECWLAQVDSNHRPRAYQARALTTWAMSQYFAFGSEEWRVKSEEWRVFFSFLSSLLSSLSRWWRWWDSNPWPPACRAGALPAELHPHISGYAFFSPKDPSKLNNELKLYSLRNRHFMSHTFL